MPASIPWLIFYARYAILYPNIPKRGFSVEDIKPIIAKNITALRQQHKMTQIELAEKLNYSDKAVSKWERGESIPDIGVLKAIADMFGVSLDYLLESDHTERPVAVIEIPPKSRRNQAVVTVLSILLVWFLATLTFVLLNLIVPSWSMRWLIMLYALPVSAIVWLVLNSIWFNRRRNFLIISLLMWSALLSIVVTLVMNGIFAWQLMLLGVLGQVAIVVWSLFRVHTKK